MNPTSTLQPVRHRLKRLKADFQHIFPGLIKIVRDPKTGTIKFSFMETKMSSLVKHRVALGERLAKYHLPVHDPDTVFRFGTWRYKTDRVRYTNPESQKKRVYYVLTFFFDPYEGEKVTCNFIPTWQKAVVYKTDAEIEQELRKVLASHTLLKSLGINPVRSKKTSCQPTS
jgi:hypothetical protein